MRILSFFAAIVLLIISVACFATLGASFLAMAFPIGACLVASGFSGAMAYLFGNTDIRTDNGWFLAESLLTFIMGCVTLMNQLAADIAIAYVFGMWLLVPGLLRLIAGVTAHRVKSDYQYWQWTVGFAGLSTAFGIYSFFNADLLAFSNMTIVAIVLLLQGVNVLMFGLAMPSKKQAKRRRKKKNWYDESQEEMDLEELEDLDI